MTESTNIDPDEIGETCECCGDELDLHIGGKPCTGGAPGTQETYAERRARIVRDQEGKRKARLFGEVR